MQERVVSDAVQGSFDLGAMASEQLKGRVAALFLEALLVCP